jgi:hypothetical protein
MGVTKVSTACGSGRVCPLRIADWKILAALIRNPKSVFPNLVTRPLPQALLTLSHYPGLK